MTRLGRRRGKETERTHARLLGTTRIGSTGKDTGDSENKFRLVESKERKRLPGWLKDAVAVTVHRAAGRQPLVVLHELGRPYDEDLVVMRLRDFREWFVGTREAKPREEAE